MPSWIAVTPLGIVTLVNRDAPLKARTPMLVTVLGIVTLVNPDAGYVPIEQVTGEHLLLTHTGQYKPINNLQRKLLPAGQPVPEPGATVGLAFDPAALHVMEGEG